MNEQEIFLKKYQAQLEKVLAELTWDDVTFPQADPHLFDDLQIQEIVNRATSV